MSEHHLPLRHDRLVQMRLGTKDLDVRVDNKRTRRIMAGDFITFRSSMDSIRVKVLAARTYKSFEQMLAHEDFRRIAPEMIGKGQLLMALTEFYAFHQEVQGVYVFEISKEE